MPQDPHPKRPKVLAVVSRRYNGNEFWISLQVLGTAEIQVDVCSTNLIIRDEVKDTAHRIKMLVSDLASVSGADYDGITVISGNPMDTEKYYTDVHVQRLIKELDDLGKPLAGICAGVPALAPAVRGKKVSWFPLQKSREILTAAGAILTDVGLTVDQNVVTAENEWQTRVWAEAFRDLLLGK